MKIVDFHAAGNLKLYLSSAKGQNCPSLWTFFRLGLDFKDMMATAVPKLARSARKVYVIGVGMTKVSGDDFHDFS